VTTDRGALAMLTTDAEHLARELLTRDPDLIDLEITIDLTMWQPYLLEARYELVKLRRLPAFAVPAIAFPVVFYLLFGIAISGTRATGAGSIRRDSAELSLRSDQRRLQGPGNTPPCRWR
jgi:hypothetical protein